MFTSGATLEEVCEALQLDTAPVHDIADATGDETPVDPPRLSDKKLDALTSLVAALRHQVAALVQTSEADGAEYSHIVGPITATAHALALEVDDLRNGDEKVFRDETKAERKRRVATQRALAGANDDAGAARPATPTADMARLRSVRDARPATGAAKPARTAEARAPVKRAEADDAEGFEAAVADANASERPKPNPLADVLARARAHKAPSRSEAPSAASAKPKISVKPKAAEPAPEDGVSVADNAIDTAPAAPAEQPVRVARTGEPAARAEAAQPPAQPDDARPVGAAEAIVQRASKASGAFEKIASPGTSRPRSPDVKPVQPAQGARPSAPKAKIEAPAEPASTAEQEEARSRPATAEARLPEPVKRFDAPKASPVDSAKAEPKAEEKAPARPKALTPPKMSRRAVSDSNPLRGRLNAAIGQISDLSKGNETIDGEAFSRLR